MALNQYNALPAPSQIRKYSLDLQRQAISKDIYVNLRADAVVYQHEEQMSIPNGIYQKISGGVMSGSNSVRVTFKETVNANILRGRAVAVGTEVAPATLTGDLFRNNYRFVVQAPPGYGEDRLDAEPYKLYETHVKDLSPHAAAEEGLEIRMAYLETYGWNLMAGSTVNLCPAQWNRHFYVAGVPTLAQQPAFHPTYATYTNRIVGAMNLASGLTGTFPQTAAQMLSGLVMDQLARFAWQRRVLPLVINGHQAFVLSISDLQAIRFSNPNFVDTLGNRWVAMNNLDEKTQNWYGILGRWASAAGPHIYVVVDDRLPSLIPTGTAEPFGLTPGYMWPTDLDLRNLDNPLARDASILHGKGGVVNFEQEKMHMISDDYDYNIRNGAGYAGVRGIQQLQFDTTPADPTGAGRIQMGSAIVVLGRSETL